MPARKRPKQKPITKVEASGDIILASYPNLVKSKAAIASPITSSPSTPSTQQQPQTESMPYSQLEPPSSTASSLPTSSSRSPINQDMPSSSSADVRKEEGEQKRKEHYYNTQPVTTEEKKSSWAKPKTLIPIIGVAVAVVAVASILAFNLFGGGGGANQPNTPPIANAGEGKTVNSGDTVTLDGSKSTDPDGSVASYLWKQIAGPPIVLNAPNTARPSFTAPNVTSDTKLTFDLLTKDNKGTGASKPASVDIIVKPVHPAIKQQPSAPLVPPPKATQPIVTNHPPVANNQSVVTSMNKAITITLTANDPDLNDKIIAILVSKPSHGTLGNIDQNTGNITYTPNPGFTGTDKFTYKVNDGKVDSKSVGAISITVNQPPSSSSNTIATNHPPTTSNQSVTTNKNKPVNITLGASDPDLNDSLTAQIVSQPSHGKLSEINQVTGVVIYTPNPGFTGTDKFTYKVNDGKVDSKSVGAISITVNDTP